MELVPARLNQNATAEKGLAEWRRAQRAQQCRPSRSHIARVNEVADRGPNLGGLLRDGLQRAAGFFTNSVPADSSGKADLICRLNALSPAEFESWVAARLAESGYSVAQTGGPGDEGVDIHARRGTTLMVVQCKRFRSGSAGRTPRGNFLVRSSQRVQRADYWLQLDRSLPRLQIGFAVNDTSSSFGMVDTWPGILRTPSQRCHLRSERRQHQDGAGVLLLSLRGSDLSRRLE
jgi:Restriction endonuclease